MVITSKDRIINYYEEIRFGYKMAKQALRVRPTLASYMMLIGSVLIFIEGLLSIIAHHLMAPILSMLSSALGLPYFGISSSVLGMLFAIGIAFCAIRTNVKEPWEVRRWSTFGVILVILSLIDFGGFGIGFVLAFAGSIMALTYNS